MKEYVPNNRPMFTIQAIEWPHNARQGRKSDELVTTSIKIQGHRKRRTGFETAIT